ncbi:MAG: hypothetical protein ACRD40_06170 [Candidatus Acidiferrales bacterium]
MDARCRAPPAQRVFDWGTGAISGYSVAGRDDMLPALRETLEPLKQLGVIRDFLLEGIPTLLSDQDFVNYLGNYHSSSDTFDKIDLANLKKQWAIAAITAYALADSPRIAPVAVTSRATTP